MNDRSQPPPAPKKDMSKRPNYTSMGKPRKLNFNDNYKNNEKIIKINK